MSKTRANTGRRKNNNNTMPKTDHSGFNIDGTSKEELEVALKLQKLTLGTEPPCPAGDMDLSCPTDKKSAKKKLIKLHPDRNRGCEELAGWMTGKYGSTCYGDKNVHSGVRWDSKDENQVKREAKVSSELDKLQKQMGQNMDAQFNESENNVPSHCSPKKIKKANGVVGRYCENPDVTDKLCECREGSPANERVMTEQSSKSKMLALKDGSVGPSPRDLAGLSGTTNQPVDMGHCQSAVDPTTKKTYYYHGEKSTWDPSDPMCHEQLVLQDSSSSKSKKHSLKSAAKRVVAKNQASRAGEALVGALADTRAKHGHAMVENITHHAHHWEQGTVAADSASWAGEKFAHNTATGEYIIWSQKVTQDDCGNKGICASPSAEAADSCSRCVWVLYPSVKYGTESDASGKHFANVPGQFWYYNKNGGTWHTEKPEGIEFDQVEVASVTKKLYGSKSHAMDKLKRAAKKTAAVSAVSKSDDSGKKAESESDPIDKEKKKQLDAGISAAATIKEEEQERFAIFERFMNPKTNKIKELDTNNVLGYYLL